MAEKPTVQELEAYIQRQQERLTKTSSAWMKSEIRKGIKLAQAEIDAIRSNADGAK